MIISQSCLTVSNNDTKLQRPKRPIILDFEYKEVKDGYFVDYENMKNLDTNLVRLKTYIEQLEELTNGTH